MVKHGVCSERIRGWLGVSEEVSGPDRVSGAGVGSGHSVQCHLEDCQTADPETGSRQVHAPAAGHPQGSQERTDETRQGGGTGIPQTVPAIPHR